MPLPVFPAGSRNTLPGNGREKEEILRNSHDRNVPAFFIDELVKSRKTLLFVIPVKTGIQYFKVVTCTLDSRLRGNDDF